MSEGFDVYDVVERYYSKGWAAIPICWKESGKRCPCAAHRDDCPGSRPVSSDYARLATELPPIAELWEKFWLPVLHDVPRGVVTRVWFDLATVLRDMVAIEAKTPSSVRRLESGGLPRTWTMKTPTNGKIWFFNDNLVPPPLNDKDFRVYRRGDIVPLPWS